MEDQKKTLENEKAAKELQLQDKKELLSKETNEELKAKQQKEIEALEKEIADIVAKINEFNTSIQEQVTKVKNYEVILTGISTTLNSLTK